MKANIKKILAAIFILIVLVLLFYLLKNNQEDIERIENISPYYILILSLLTLFEFYLNGVMLKILVTPFNVRLKMKEWLGLSILTTFGNYLTFLRGGTATKAVYLKKKYNLSYPDFLASVGASYILTVFVYGLLGMLFSIIMLLFSNLFNSIIFMLFLAVFIIALFLVILSPKFPESDKKILNHIANIFKGWTHLKSNRKFLLKFSLLILVFYIESVIKMFLLYKALSYDISFLSAAFISLTSSITMLASITPAGLGVREAVVAITSSLLNIGLKSGIYAATLDRAISIIWLAILGPIFSYILLWKTTKTS